MNNAWCRLCKLWVDDYHFVRWVDKGFLRQEKFDGCGQSREDIRYHPSSPSCGDVWEVEKDLFFVVDYKDSFQTGLTYSDGRQRGFCYTQGFHDYLQSAKAVLVSSFEEIGFPYCCDERGWTSDPNDPNYSKEKSLEFLNERIREYHAKENAA